MGLDLWGLGPQEKAIWFGILVLMVVHRPAGAAGRAERLRRQQHRARDVPIAETYQGVMPFLASDLLRIVALMAFPGLALGVVRWWF